MNLLQETKQSLMEYGKEVCDIVFIGSSCGEYECSWPEFEVLANKEYDDGFGGSEVATDLIIAFADGEKMVRGEYDGSEWWEIQKPFKAAENTKKINTLFSRMELAGLMTEIMEANHENKIPDTLRS